jgi:coenzyme F420-0:L-glutamate ligase/coenzyme F420-1:gamma-L-glutamate ligase
VKKMIQIFGLGKIPLVKRGDKVGDQIVKAAKEEGLQILDRDIVVVAQKVVSKAEDRVFPLKSITPSAFAKALSKTTGKDPRHLEAILSETQNIIRMREAHLIVETRHGFICANAGVDRSNVEKADSVALLPIDPDKSAHKIRERIRELTGADVGVIVSDTFGRAWRIGQVDVAIGLDGLRPIADYRGKEDMFGYVLNVTQIAVADELASAAELVMKKSDGIPAAIVRGFEYPRGKGSARDLIRPREEDLFR